MRTRRDFHFRSRSSANHCWPFRFRRRALSHKLVLKLAHETLHRPRAGFTKGADRSSAWNIVGNTQQVIRIFLPSLTMCKSVQGFAHPQRTFAAGCALAATLVRVE